MYTLCNNIDGITEKFMLTASLIILIEDVGRRHRVIYFPMSFRDFLSICSIFVCLPGCDVRPLCSEAAAFSFHRRRLFVFVERISLLRRIGGLTPTAEMWQFGDMPTHNAVEGYGEEVIGVCAGACYRVERKWRANKWRVTLMSLIEQNLNEIGQSVAMAELRHIQHVRPNKGPNTLGAPTHAK